MDLKSDLARSCEITVVCRNSVLTNVSEALFSYLKGVCAMRSSLTGSRPLEPRPGPPASRLDVLRALCRVRSYPARLPLRGACCCAPLLFPAAPQALVRPGAEGLRFPFPTLTGAFLELSCLLPILPLPSLGALVSSASTTWMPSSASGDASPSGTSRPVVPDTTHLSLSLSLSLTFSALPQHVS